MRRLPIVFAAVMCAIGLLLTGCAPSERDLLPLPENEQTISGVLAPVPLSITRRGTHKITVNGLDAYYVESTAVSLRAFEGRDVTVKGMLHYNTDPSDLPVLSVTSVEAGGSVLQTLVMAPLGLTLEAPSGWIARKAGATLSFALAGSGTRPSFLTVERSGRDLLPEEGSPMVVGAAKAVSVAPDGTALQGVYVQHGGEIIVFSFAPPGDSPMLERMREDFVRLLKSVRFTTAPSSSPVTATGSAAVRCGGPAGILCPDGLSCAITDTALNIGVCIKLGGGSSSRKGVR